MTMYSHSKLRSYEQCPQKYKFQYIDKIKVEVKESIELFLGRRTHKTLKKTLSRSYVSKRKHTREFI